MTVRRRTTWRSVAFNLLLLLFAFALCSSAAAETKKPSCAACLSTGRAVERALLTNMGGEGSHKKQQLQRRRGRSFPAFASEPAVAAALAAPSTCEEVPRRHRQSCLSLLASHSAALTNFLLNAPSLPSHHQGHQQPPSCTEELCVRLSGACRPHEVSGEL